MESISHLRAVLLNALNSRGQPHNEQELFDELLLHKTRLWNVFDVGRSNPDEQREIESGKTIINGETVAINSDFARQVIFLSNELRCSQRYMASLLHTTMTEDPNTSTSTSAGIEAAVVEYHRRRRHLVDCLRYIFESAALAETMDATPFYARIDAFAQSQLIPGTKVATGGEVTLAAKLFQELDTLGKAIDSTVTTRQNAGSNTTGVDVQGAVPALGFDVLNARLDSLKYERRHLACTLFIIARLGYLSSFDIRKMVEWLADNPDHAMTYYILTSILVAFDPVDPKSSGGKIRQNLATGKETMNWMKHMLGMSKEWKDPGLKATVLLKWTLFLTETRHRDASLEHRDGFMTEELETQIWNAVQGGTFTFLALAIMQLQKRHTILRTTSLTNLLALQQDPWKHREIPAEDFEPAVLSAFETLIRTLIMHASSELRKIKQRQEDLVMSNTRSDRTRMSRGSTSQPFQSNSGQTDSETIISPRNDIAILYSSIGLLYSTLPSERALQFWGSAPQSDSRTTYLEQVETTAGKLPAFLQWAVWSTQTRDTDMSMALYDMIAGLAKGQQCSELAYNFMAKGGGEIIIGGPTVSWSTIFGLLESWATATSNTRVQINSIPQPAFGSMSQAWQSQNQQHQQQFLIGQKDVLLAQSFLRLLATVVTHSVAVRVAISGHTHFRAIPTLVSLVPLGVPLELKGALFETLAAFCEPGAGQPGIEICKAVWTLMERLEVINVRVAASGSSGLLPAVRGVEVELEEVEAVYKMYPSTIPFLKLLSTLIHTPKRVPIRNLVADEEPLNTIPDSLGQPYRLPGIGPFVSFVIDNVFLTIAGREYLRPSDRWQKNDLCLCFIERSLASYDLESLVRSTSTAQLQSETIPSLLVHPGYDIMKRLLTSTPLRATILSYIVDGAEGLEKDLTTEEPYLRSTITRVLRIVLRVLEIQGIYVDVLIPFLSEFDSVPLIGTAPLRSDFTKLDHSMSYGPDYVPAVAAYIAFPAYSELVLLSVKILNLLSASSTFSNLATLIERSSDSERILNGFRHIMSSESLEDILEAEALADQKTGAGAPDIDGVLEPFEQATRLAALDLFIQNTRPGCAYPNIAHFFLYGGTNSAQEIQDPHALGSRQMSIHIILNLLCTGVPRVKVRVRNRQRQEVIQSSPLFVTLPGLAERCYRVIFQLCVHPRTSEFTMRYLRTREDFFARQLSAIPSQVPPTRQDQYIEVLYNNESRIMTTVSALSSFIRLRSWILDLVSLDLHILTNKGHLKGVTELLDILFDSEEGGYQGNLITWEYDIHQSFQEVGQSSLRIMEIVQSLSFDWSDSLTVKPVDLEFFAQLDLFSCLRADAMGCEVIDRSALLSLLTVARRSLHALGRILTPAHVEQLNAEVAYILESCAVENHRREIRHAVATGYEAWRRLLDMALAKCFTHLPHDRRENMLFDLLHVVPSILRSADTQETTTVLLSEVVLSLVSKLREDRRHQLIVHSVEGDAEAVSLPAERLYNILRSILECVLDSNHVEQVRGNLYASLINFLHLVSSADSNAEANDIASSQRTPFYTPAMRDLHNGDQPSTASSQMGGFHHSASALETGCLSVMKHMTERLVGIVSRDAIDGTEIWKTVAFMLLDSLIQLSQLERQNVVLSTLVRHGILSNFVRGLKESDTRLQSVLKPDPDDLNSLYVYEAKMSFFIRLVQIRAGAERLLEAQLLSTLTQCDYLDTRPEVDQSFMDKDSFLPSAVQRYHQMFMPALQVVHGMLMTLGSRHVTASHQTLSFLSAHRDTIVILLKNEADDFSLSVIEEMHLLVSLCAAVLPLVPMSERVSANTGFGAIHTAILSLGTKCLGNERWVETAKPQTDSETLEASVYESSIISQKPQTKFEFRVRERERRLRAAIVAYIGAASDFTEPEMILVMSPVTTPLRQEEHTSSRFLATVPTIGDAVECLNIFCADLTDTLKQIADISAELAAKEYIRLDISFDSQILGLTESDMQDLTIRQKKSLICREMERTRNVARSRVKSLIGTLEMLLLLVWRHLVYYFENHQSNTLQLQPQLQEKNRMSTSLRLLTTTDVDIETFQTEVGKRIAPVLQKLATLNLDSDTIGSQWRSNQAYIEIMCRRLRDIARLHDFSEQNTSP